MSSRVSSFEQNCWQEGVHGTHGSCAIYQVENLRDEQKKNRKYWLPEAINRYKKNPNIKAISYNERCHSVYLHSEIDTGRWRNRNNPTFREKNSNRHEWHTLVCFLDH